MEQTQCNNKNKDGIQTIDIDDTLEYTDIRTEKEQYHVSSTNIKSVNTQKMSKYVLTKKNTRQDNNTIDNDELHDKVLSRRSSNFSTISVNGACDITDINDFSIAVPINEDCTVDCQKPNRERTAKKNSENINQCTKRVKLKRNFQEKNVKPHVESFSQPQLDDSPNTDILSKDKNYNNIDLRKILDKKRTKKVCMLNTIGNNAMSMEISNENNIQAVTNIVENDEICEKFSLKEETFNEDSCEKKNSAQISSPHSNDLHLSNAVYDASQETRHGQTDINTCKDTKQKYCQDDEGKKNNHNDEDIDWDYISIDANESFDMTL